MKIGIISNHHFSLPTINYLLNNGLVAGFAVPEFQNQNFQNIKQLSEAHHLPFNILQKNNLSNDIKNWITSINAKVVFVFSFPYKIPDAVLNMPKLEFINFHPSILPSYRGPDPLFWQIKNGVKETGITAHKMDTDFDTGPIVHIEKENITSNDTYGFLESKLSITLLKCVSNTLNVIMNNNNSFILSAEQNEANASYYSRPQEDDLLIDWDKQNAESICNLVNASNPKYQGAVTFYKNVPVRILQTSIEDGDNLGKRPGTIVDIKDRLKVAALDDKIISFDIIYVMEGCYTGDLFCNLFNLSIGEKFGIAK
jgi:methionyl-tRNA formyltransferase